LTGTRTWMKRQGTARSSVDVRRDDWAWDRGCKTPHVPLYGFHATQGDPEYWDLVPLTWAPINAPESMCLTLDQVLLYEALMDENGKVATRSGVTG
jgi:hypothetical protein